MPRWLQKVHLYAKAWLEETSVALVSGNTKFHWRHLSWNSHPCHENLSSGVVVFFSFSVQNKVWLEGCSKSCDLVPASLSGPPIATIEPAWHRRLRRLRQLARWQIRRHRSLGQLGKRKLRKAVKVLEQHHSQPKDKNLGLGLTRRPWMWPCSCGCQNASSSQWCYGCSSHWSWSTSKQSQTTAWYRTRSASRHRKGAKGSKHAKGKGQGKVEKEAKNNQGQKGTEEQEVIRNFQPFTSADLKDKSEPWTNSTPTTRLPRSSASTALADETKEKETIEDSEEDEASKEHALALMDKKDLPPELRQALVKFTKKAAPEMTHSDLNRLRRLKNSIQKNKERIEVLDAKWMSFQKMSRTNWEQQKARFLSSREEEMAQLRTSQEKLAMLQKELATKATAEEEGEESEPQDMEEVETQMEAPPWEVDLPEDDFEEPGIGVNKESKALIPFSRPAKISRTGDKEKSKGAR